MTKKRVPQPASPVTGAAAGNRAGQDVWYHVLKCRPVRFQSANDHFQVLVDCAGQSFWFTINVRFLPKSGQPSDNIVYLTNDNFTHPITSKLKAARLPWGFTTIPEQPDGLALDYVRANLLDLSQMKSLTNADATVTDLSELLASYIRRVQNAPDAEMYVFGSKFPLPGQAENQGSNPFHLSPNIGLHDVHLNQGSVGSHAGSNAPWQDGALFVHFPADDTWAAVFLAFETQIQTLTGQQPPVPQPAQPAPAPTPPIVTAATVRIIAALVNPSGNEVGQEQVYLLNTTNQPVDLNGWQLEDGQRKRETLSGTIAARQVLIRTLGGTLRLPNQGGTLTLYDNRGAKVHGVSYVQTDRMSEDTLVVF